MRLEASLRLNGVRQNMILAPSTMALLPLSATRRLTPFQPAQEICRKTGQRDRDISHFVFNSQKVGQLAMELNRARIVPQKYMIVREQADESQQRTRDPGLLHFRAAVVSFSELAVGILRGACPAGTRSNLTCPGGCTPTLR